jgi:hypothetical protein
VPRLWYVRRKGRVQGPFPTGAVLQDRLVGRIGADEKLSAGQDEWRPFDAWPELVAALASTSADESSGDGEWGGERAKARMRWADERTALERRTPHAMELPAGERRASDQERRSPQSTEARLRAVATRRLSHDVAMIKIIGVIAIVVAAIALLAWLYGPVNPVPVRIR